MKIINTLIKNRDLGGALVLVSMLLSPSLTVILLIVR